MSEPESTKREWDTRNLEIVVEYVLKKTHNIKKIKLYV